MPIEPVETLKRLVAIPSVNPMGRAAAGPEFFEHRLTDFLAQTFDELGMPWRRQNVAPLRDNIFAWLEGRTPVSQGGPLILFDAHQDTVPADSFPGAFDPVVRDGRLYGRGACDVKGGMAAMLTAMSRLAVLPQRERPNVVMAATVNEEFGFSGALKLCGTWNAAEAELWTRRPDAIVVAEPTELNVVVAHKGAVRWRCHVRGRAAHSSQPEAGDNAIYKMARVLSALEVYQRDVAPGLASHPLCGRSSLSVGTIVGGISVNTVPDRATIEIDRRLAPGEKPETAYGAVVEYLDARRFGFPIQHDEPFLRSPGLSDSHNQPLAARLQQAAQSASRSAALVGVPFGTNASIFAATGAPTVVFGPGSIQQAHTTDEWVSLDQLELAADILLQFARLSV